jgi:hypothetical protein
MTVICPKCSLVRPPDATNPDWQCPGCGICYAKFQNRPAEPVRAEHVIYVEEKRGWDTVKIAKIVLLFALGWGVSAAFNRTQSTGFDAEMEEAAVIGQLESDSGIALANAALEESDADATLLHGLSGRLEKHCAANKYGLSESACIARIRDNEDACALDVARRFPGKIGNVERMQEIAQAHADCIFEE